MKLIINFVLAIFFPLAMKLIHNIRFVYIFILTTTLAIDTIFSLFFWLLLLHYAARNYKTKYIKNGTNTDPNFFTVFYLDF